MWGGGGGGGGGGGVITYARWNKRIGYCRGFNVIIIAALLLNVMERKEDDALKVIKSPWLLGDG